MKLLLDQGLPRSAIGSLAAAGIVAEHVGDLGMAAATDAEVLAEARSRGAVVVSLDSDFHALLAAAGETKPSVVRLREEGLKADALTELLLRVLPAIQAELEQGAVASVTRQQVRVHLLPIGKRLPK